MIEGILSQIVKQRLLVCLSAIGVLLWGLLSLKTLPIDAFPDLTNNQVQILTENPGSSSEEVEQRVTIPLESALSGIPGVQTVRSISKFGLSVITLIFTPSTETYFARQLVNERIQSIRSRLPEESVPELGPITTGMGEVFQYVVEGHGYSAQELKTLHDWTIRYLLRQVPGVSEVNTWGGFTEDYVITLYPERLLQYNLTIPEVLEALRRNHQNFSAGIIEHQSEQVIVRGLGQLKTPEALSQVLIKQEQNHPITLHELADVRVGHLFRQGAVTKDGQGEVVTGLVMMRKGENSLNVIQQIKARIKQLQSTLPESVRIVPFYDQSRLIQQTVQTLTTNLLEGGGLVCLILFLVLRDMRAAFIVALSIPFSMCCSFIGMKALGLTANIMSLGAIDFGMIVDGSVVMVEDILRRNNENSLTVRESSRLQTVLKSVQEMARPILFGILIITVVYLPILSLEGMEYQLFSPMVFTLCFALLGSLIASLTLVPVLCSFSLNRKKSTIQTIASHEAPWLSTLKVQYLRGLTNALNNRSKWFTLTGILFVMAILLLSQLGSEFVPKLDEGDLIIEMRNAPGITLSKAVETTTLAEKLLKHFPEIKTVVSKTGRPDLATDPMGVYQSDIYVILTQAARSTGPNKAVLIETMRNQLTKNLPASQFNFTQPIAMRVDELVSGVRSDLALKLFGESPKQLQALATRIAAILSTIPGQRDLQIEPFIGTPQLTIIPDRKRMAQLGISLETLRDTLQTAIVGIPVTTVLDGRRQIGIRIQFPDNPHLHPENIAQLRLSTGNGSGQTMPISAIASIHQQESLEIIPRESGQRRILIQCNVRGRDIGSFVQDSQKRIAQQLSLPAGYHLEWGGQFENKERANRKLLFAIPAALVIIFLLLLSTFGSATLATLVMLSIPLALIGGAFSLWLREMYLSVPATIGFIALFGIAVLNGVVLMSTLIKQPETIPLTERILNACQLRFRPVLMTALVAAIGFLPMALSTGAGAEIQKPLATVVIGGILSSTLLTLFILPLAYYRLKQRQS